MADPIKERPILFSGPMVRAILENRKSQTRRVFKGPEKYSIPTINPFVVLGEQKYRQDNGKLMWFGIDDNQWTHHWSCPYAVGNRLWVRETFFCNSFDYPEPTQHARENLYYRADDDNGVCQTHDCEAETIPAYEWKPSIHMPRWASRITLEIVSVRAERVQDISEEDAIAEGMTGYDERPSPASGLGYPPTIKYARLPVCQFQRLWDEINGKRGYGWTVNPWCWVIEFKRVEEVNRAND